MARFGIAHRLYTGDFSVDFVGRRKVWYLLSGFVLLVSIVSLGVRGLTLSIDFKGGALFTVPAGNHSVAEAQSILGSVGIGPDASTIQMTGTGGDRHLRITTPILASNARTEQVENALAKGLDVSKDQLNPQQVGASWGSDITKKAIESLIVFLLAVVVYLSIRYELKMAVAAIVAVLHDLLITAGIYSLVGFEVSPSTVIALLTILGYSLYDTVVVFDKVRENTAGLGPNSRTTFSQATNLAINQTLVRSINTTIIALLPVAGLLFIGAGLLGAGTLKDLSLALFIGLASGAYSSIFIASPLVCDLKEREPGMRQLSRRVANREAQEAKAGIGARDTAVAEGSEDTEDSVEAGVAYAAGASSGGATVRNPRPTAPRRRPSGGRPGAPKRRR